MRQRTGFPSQTAAFANPRMRFVIRTLATDGTLAAGKSVSVILGSSIELLLPVVPRSTAIGFPTPAVVVVFVADDRVDELSGCGDDRQPSLRRRRRDLDRFKSDGLVQETGATEAIKRRSV